MTKLLIGILVLFLLTYGVNGFCADQWAEEEPLGTQSVSDLDLLLEINNEAIGRVLRGQRVGCEVLASSATQVTVAIGEIGIPNAGSTVMRMRQNTAAVTVTWADIDTGAKAISTYYYLYADGDTDQTTFDVTISASSSAPSGGTYYKKIGWFYNDASGNIVSVGNIKGGGVPNAVTVTGTSDIQTTSPTYEDMTDMVIYFVCSGRPVEIIFNAPFNGASASIWGVIDIDGTDKIEFGNFMAESGNNSSGAIPLIWLEELSAGTHTIKVQWKVTAGTGNQEGLTEGKRILTVKEL